MTPTLDTAAIRKRFAQARRLQCGDESDSFGDTIPVRFENIAETNPPRRRRAGTGRDKGGNGTELEMMPLMWATLTHGPKALRFIKAAAPCWNGEVVIAMFGLQLCIGLHKPPKSGKREETEMKIEWTNIRDYRKVGEYEYLKVDGVTIGRFGKVKNRTTFHAFNKCGNMEWQDMETGWNLNCSALLKKFCQSVRARENLMNAEIAEAEAKRAEQDENARLTAMVHVVPTADSREHNETSPCWCNPEIRDGVVIHNSADGREKDEK